MLRLPLEQRQLEINMTKKRDYHVVPHPEGWAVKKENAERASSVHDTKAEAMEEGKRLAKQEKVELVQHGKDGKVQDSDSYGKDPNPPKDRKH